MKALIVRLSSIGDVVHTLPVVPALKRAGWNVGWLVERASSALLGSVVSPVVLAPPAPAFPLGPALEAVRTLRAQNFEVALDFEGVWRSALWARISKAKRVVGHGGPWRRKPMSAFLVGEPADIPDDARHVIDQNLSLLRAVGVDAVGSREFPLPPSQAESKTADRILSELGLSEFIVMHPGGGWASKLWNPQGFGEVARRLKACGITSLVCWGPGEENLARQVVLASEGAAVACPAATLLEYLEIARRSRLVVAADSGPLHLACAVGVPVVGIYGPTDPASNGPFDSRDMVVRRTPLCSPCHRNRCRTHDGVMTAIAPLEVFRAIEQRLGRPGGANLRALSA